MLIEDLFRAPWHERMKGAVQKMVDNVENMKNEELLQLDLQEWERSEKRKLMITGELYYRNKTDIVKKTRAMNLEWQANSKMSYAFLRKLVDQKTGYLLSKEPSISTDNQAYADELKDIFNDDMLKRLRNVGKEAINKGIAYLYPYIDEEGELKFKKFPSENILVYWGDSEHTEVNGFIRTYEEEVYEVGAMKKTVKKAEHYHADGVNFYLVENGKFIPDVPAGIEQAYHFVVGETPYVWDKIPLIPFKYNEEEQPLIDIVKSLVDNVNLQSSTMADILADVPNFIYKLVNYGGVDLKEFLEELNRYRVIKLDENGDLDKLQADIQSGAVETDIERNRKAIYEFGRGVDTGDDDSLGNASGVALRFRYSDLDLDCNIIESEFKSSISLMLEFIGAYLQIAKGADYTEETAKFIFNRDIIINESEIIGDCQASTGILDERTIRENHPWYNELVEERLKKEEAAAKKAMEEYQFPNGDNNDPSNSNGSEDGQNGGEA